jgi:hypothetical protein
VLFKLLLLIDDLWRKQRGLMVVAILTPFVIFGIWLFYTPPPQPRTTAYAPVDTIPRSIKPDPSIKTVRLSPRQRADSIAQAKKDRVEKEKEYAAQVDEMLKGQNDTRNQVEEEKVALKPKPIGISGTWKGKGYTDSPPYVAYKVSAWVSQTQDGTVTGRFFWEDGGGGHAVEHFSGYINDEGLVLVTGNRLENVQNANGVSYGTAPYYLQLVPGGDTLKGGWKTGVPGTFVIAKVRD